jgi:hypothetical protein
MNARPGTFSSAIITLASLAGGGAWLTRRFRQRRSFEQLLEAFAYKLGQVSGIAYGRLSATVNDTVPAEQAWDLTQFDYTFEVHVQDHKDNDLRWVKADFKSSQLVGTVIGCLIGDEDTLARLALWLRQRPYSTFGGFNFSSNNTKLTFWLSDRQFDDVNQKVRRLISHTTGVPLGPPTLTTRPVVLRPDDRKPSNGGHPL